MIHGYDRDDRSNRTLFIGGLLDGQHSDMCPRQRVHYVVNNGAPVARYVRRHLSFGSGPAVRLFIWDRMDPLEALRHLLAMCSEPGPN